MPQSQKLCKRFLFDKAKVGQLTFSDDSKLWLDQTANALTLRPQSYNRVTGDPVYPTDTDLIVTTWITNPEALTQWLGFSVEPLTPNQPADTQVRFKLNDGTDDRYWSGASWDVAGAADWNTEDEVAANISSFPVTSKQLAVVINLVSDDGVSTPTVNDLDLLMEVDIDYVRSLIADSFMADLKENVRPVLEHAMGALGGDKLDLRDLETAYNVLDVTAVYNVSDDPNRLTDLLSSYDVTTKTIQLTGSVVRGKAMVILFQIEPEVYLEWGSQDYTEVSKIPAIVIESVDLTGNQVQARFEVRELTTYTAVIRRSPFKLMVEFAIVLIAGKNRNLLPMVDQMLAYLATTHQLRWRAIDENVSMRSLDQGTFRQRPSLSDEHATRFTVVLDDVYLWLSPEETVFLVQQLNLNFSDSSLQGGPRWSGIQTGTPRPKQSLQ
jgi:hypothetical protein